MLLTSSIHCYADDSTGDALYTGRANISRENVAEYPDKLVSEVEYLLYKVSEWGRLNLVQFNPQKTQFCTFTAKKNPFVVSPQFKGTPLAASAKRESFAEFRKKHLSFSKFNCLNKSF
ncbi:unnamed protein product [Parnassius mnemosyne]|uniref:Uncharacterized protein n=1 Tax=Parnassius mnemosyne TaxID=213953 RepID=A0AAV1LVU2_9NEOP